MPDVVRGRSFVGKVIPDVVRGRSFVGKVIPDVVFGLSFVGRVIPDVVRSIANEIAIFATKTTTSVTNTARSRLYNDFDMV
jgi:hypothetical protein